MNIGNLYCGRVNTLWWRLTLEFRSMTIGPGEIETEKKNLSMSNQY